MKPDDEQRITRWIDGELDDADVENLLAEYPELRQEKAAAREMRDLLRSELETGDKIPFPDFFNRQIQKHIEEEQELEARKKAYQAIPEKDFFSWFVFSRNMAAAALLVLLGVFIGKAFFDSRAGGSQIVDTYTPDPSVQAVQYFNSDANATVLELKGLEAIPADSPITGHRTANYVPDSNYGITTLFSSSSSEPSYLIVTDGNEVPTIYEVEIPLASRTHL